MDPAIHHACKTWREIASVMEGYTPQTPPVQPPSPTALGVAQPFCGFSCPSFRACFLAHAICQLPDVISARNRRKQPHVNNLETTEMHFIKDGAIL
jgi:hypothetical protein